MASKLILIRHGITEGNLKRWFYGATDVPLAEEGKKMLKTLVDEDVYPKLPDDADCYTTGLVRTEETFDIIYGGREHRTLPMLREISFGQYECKSYEELKGFEDFEKWVYDQTGEAKFPGGESKREFATRIGSGLKELLGFHRLKELSHRHSGKDAVSLVICHGGVISAIMMELFPDKKENMWDWIPDPGFGYAVEFKGGEPVMYEKIDNVKKLGFGLMRLPMKGEEIDIEETKKMVDLFMDRGYNYFDTAYGYQDGASEAAAKVALVNRYPRDSFKLATKLPAWMAKSEEEAKAMFETSLERTGAGYFDYFLYHNLGAERTHFFDDYHIWEFLKEKKNQGLIKNLGFSIHDKADELEKVLQEHPYMDFVQLQINYADWEDSVVESRKCYEVARKYNKPVIIMEPVKGGSLTTLPEPIQKIFRDADEEASIASWAIRFAASLEGVITVLSGMSNMEQLEDNLKTMDEFRPLSKEEYQVVEKVRSAIENTPHVPCTSCKYCIKECPQGINIPGVFRAVNNLLMFGNRSGAEGNYKWETREGGTASKCIACGTCESICPQKIDIIEQLRKAAEAFE